MRLALLVFIVGCLTSAIGTLIGLSVTHDGDVAQAMDLITSRPGPYSVAFLASGLTWIIMAPGLRQLPVRTGLSAWLIRAGVVILLIGPLSLVVGTVLRAILLGTPFPSASYFGNPRSWFGYLDTPPFNVIVAVRSLILVALVMGAGNRGWAMAGGRSYLPGPIKSASADQVTRLLCGHALLNGAVFRRDVLAFFRNKWIATAPEFGLDAGLLVRVCSFAEARDKASDWRLGGVAIAAFLLSSVIPGIAIPLAVFAAAFLWYRKSRQDRDLARLFTQADFSKARASSRFTQTLDADVVAALPENDQNLIVYRGFWPFVGAGFDLGGWSLVTFIDRPKVEGSTAPIERFTIAELYAEMESGMQELALPGLRCQDFFFVRGIDIKHDPTILGDLANRPRQHIAPDLAAIYAEEPNAHLRPYKCIQAFDWGGEVIISYFLRCALQGNTLLVEMKRYVLPPVAEAYRSVDRMPPDNIPARISQALASLVIGPVMAVLAPFALFARGQQALSRLFVTEDRLAKRRRKAARDNPAHDYGTATTLRMHYAQNRYLHYFQLADADFDKKLIERKILDEIERFLDERGIDTTDIRDRQTTILNSGILVQGGDVRAETLAVGQGAQATRNEAPSRTRGKETV